MHRAAAAAGLLALLAAPLLRAQDAATPPHYVIAQVAFLSDAAPAPKPPAAAVPETCPVDAPLWQPPWGWADLRIIPEGPKVAPNGEEYHPNFSMDLDLNAWVWRDQHLYLFGDARFWGEKPEFGVTNANDGFFGTSKRQFDLSGGAAWNYSGPWEARAFGYSLSNLNRGFSPVTPSGINDGGGLENRYYLSPEYADLGRPGFDVSKASFLSVGYYPTKDMVGNDGQTFEPGLMLRAYLVHDLWDWPCYAFGDATYIGERSGQPKLLLFDLGLAARPFRCCPQCEFRVGAESTADFQAADVFSLWYVSVRYVF